MLVSLTRLRRLVVIAVLGCLGCTVERRKSDAELGLNPHQASGRHVYDQYCARCHEPYSSRKKKGPSLQGVFHRDYFTVSGMPANDQRARDLIVYGRDKMPGYSQELTDRKSTRL